jgi:hypothetical protein
MKAKHLYLAAALVIMLTNLCFSQRNIPLDYVETPFRGVKFSVCLDTNVVASTLTNTLHCYMKNGSTNAFFCYLVDYGYVFLTNNIGEVYQITSEVSDRSKYSVKLMPGDSYTWNVRFVVGQPFVLNTPFPPLVASGSEKRVQIIGNYKLVASRLVNSEKYEWTLTSNAVELRVIE